LLVNTTGTAYVFCPDYTNHFIKFYEYYLSGNFNNGGEILEVEKKDIQNHHIRNIEEIPNFIKKEASDETIEKMKEVLR